MREERELGWQTALVSDERYQGHNPQDWHPECPARCEAVLAGITRAVPAGRLLALAPRMATVEEVALCHPASYIEQVRADVASGASQLSTGDTEIVACSYEVALLAVGGVLAAVDAVCEGRVRNAFCAVRPPGHHACRERGMGFCIFNNVAVAARYAQQRYGIERVLIVDWDVHHGNGTQEIFYADPTVYYFSTHQWPLFPGTGAPTETGRGAGMGYTRNCIFAAGATGADVMAAFQDQLLPAMESFQPGLVLVSAGFDARKDEPLSNLELEDAEFGALTRMVMGLADRYAGGRLVSVLEGGYGLEGLGLSAGEHVRVLAGG
jgi:acetoin utilization deacetylase AcuC-like enzyme